MKSIILKTNIRGLKAAMNLSNLLPHYFKGARVEFEAIQKRFNLQISAPRLSTARVLATMHELGYKAEVI